MTRFKAIFILFGLLSFFSASAQNANSEITYLNAIQAAQTSVNGTARFQSIGGATTALGADMGTLSSNPAGLGVYRKSDMSISMGLGNVSTNGAYQGATPTTTSSGKTYAMIPNMGFVFTGQNKDSAASWRGGAFGISYNRVDDYQNKFSYNGVNGNSLTDNLVNKANGNSAYNGFNNNVNSPPDLTSLAAATYLVFPQNPFDINNSTYRSLANEQDSNSVLHKETVNVQGRKQQWDIAYGGNIKDKFYLGLDVGISTVKSTISRNYSETISNPTSYDPLTSFDMTEKLNIKGTGINAKLGAIYKLADWIRVGATLQTPTVYAMQATYNYNMNANYIPTLSGQGYPDSTEPGSTPQINFNYKVATPFKFTAGVALFASKGGFISSDLSFVPYNLVNMSSGTGGYDFSGDNSSIKQLCHTAINYNLGGELRRNVLRLRAGFAYYGSPYKTSSNMATSSVNFTGGVGLRFTNNYIDLAVIDSRTSFQYSPYTLTTAQPIEANVKYSAIRVMLTTGILF